MPNHNHLGNLAAGYAEGAERLLDQAENLPADFPHFNPSDAAEAMRRRAAVLHALKEYRGYWRCERDVHYHLHGILVE